MNTHIPGELALPAQESIAHLWELIHDIRFAMFTTQDRDGHLHACPMTMQNRDLGDEALIWFFMERDSETVACLQTHSEVNLSWTHPGKDRYVSACGSARVVDDKAKLNELWSGVAEAWFPDGVKNPNVALVQVQLTHASFWDIKESKITRLFQMAHGAHGIKPPLLGESAEKQRSCVTS